MRSLELLYRLIATETDDCILWPLATTAAGYGHLTKDRSRVYAHVLSCASAHGPRPHDHEAAHSCGRPACVNPRHLRWATHAENQRDKLLHGTSRRGEKHPMVKLTERQVRAIRSSRDPQVVLVNRYGISPMTISRIVRRDGWAWLDDEATDTGPVRPAHIRLDEATVRVIRASSESGVALARRYGVSPVTIHNARTGRSWKHVD